MDLIRKLYLNSKTTLLLKAALSTRVQKDGRRREAVLQAKAKCTSLLFNETKSMVHTETGAYCEVPIQADMMEEINEDHECTSTVLLFALVFSI